jgi:hypothetical protein
MKTLQILNNKKYVYSVGMLIEKFYRKIKIIQVWNIVMEMKNKNP